MRISKLYENECIISSSKDCNNINTKTFFKSKYIALKEKIKFLLLLKNPQILKTLLKAVKKFNKQVI